MYPRLAEEALHSTHNQQQTRSNIRHAFNSSDLSTRGMESRCTQFGPAGCAYRSRVNSNADIQPECIVLGYTEKKQSIVRRICLSPKCIQEA